LLVEKKLSEYTPSEAQKRTFGLIDSIKQLEDTVKQLTPTLVEGKRVLDAFEKLDIHNM
jgi:hypothetical protein